MADAGSMRVADADREQAVQDLHAHMLSGRITSQELEERVGAAYAAKTIGDLDALRADLPLSPAAVEREIIRRRVRLRRSVARDAWGATSASATCVAIWAASGAGSFWPIFVIVPTGIPVVRNALRLLGPSPDSAEVEADISRRLARRAKRERRNARRIERERSAGELPG